MELTTVAGFAAAPLLTVLLGWIFTILARAFVGEWDQSKLSNGFKITLAPVLGISLGVAAMYADMILLNPPLVINIVSWMKYSIAGFLLGAAAIGLNQIQRGGR